MILLGAWVLLLIGGCSGQKSYYLTNSSLTAVTQSGELMLSMELPARRFHVGDSVPVKVRAYNMGGKPIEINPNGLDLVQVRLYRDIGIGWERIKKYPCLAQPVCQPYLIQPGQEIFWQMDLPVEPDWPRAEQILLKVFLNDRREVAPSMLIEVISQSQ